MRPFSFRPECLELFRLKVPMVGAVKKGAFEHARGTREETDNIICALSLEGGIVGYGEGVPRDYVTGETVEWCWQQLVERAASMPRDVEVGSPADAVALVERWVSTIPDGPGIVGNATRCAIELALLDALFRGLNASVLPTLAARAGRATVPAKPNLTYTLVAAKGNLAGTTVMTQLREQYGYQAIKAKVGFGLELDLQNLARVREVYGPKADVRLDANRALSFEQAAELMGKVKAFGVRAIEDPLAGDDLGQMCAQLRELRALTGCEIILDEPIRTMSEAKLAVDQQAVDVLNIRISKNGGLLSSLDMAAYCARKNVGVHLGCQVGESAILSAAGRWFAQATGDLRWLEGSNERLKFARENDISKEDLMYGAGAFGAPLEGPGLGITVLRDRIAALSPQHATIALGRGAP